MFLLALLLCAFFPSARASCGFSWNYTPSSPFMNSSGDYRFQYVEHLADADLSRSAKPSDPKIPLNLIFTPVRGAYPGGRLLGQGWWFPAIESTCLQISERHFEMCLPNGEKVTLEHMGNGNIKGGVWLGNKRYEKITLKSSCGWRLYFEYGRLTDIYAPDNSHYVFGFSSAGVRTITYAGSPVLTVKRHFNEKTLFYDYHVTYTTAGKQQTTILQMGERPIYVTYAYTDENNRPQSQQQLKNTNSLRSIKSPDGTEKNLSFTTSALTAAGIPFRWNPKDDFLYQKGEERYSFVTIKGVPCFKTTFANGTTTISGYKSPWQIEQLPGSEIWATENVTLFDDKKRPKQKPRQVIQIDKYGRETPLRRYWYDENGKCVREWIRHETGKGIFYEKGENTEIAKKENGDILWQKGFDDKGRLLSFITGDTIYSFIYPSNCENVIVKREVNGKTSETTITYDQFNSLARCF